jgi:hypothetical protein
MFARLHLIQVLVPVCAALSLSRRLQRKKYALILISFFTPFLLSVLRERPPTTIVDLIPGKRGDSSAGAKFRRLGRKMQTGGRQDGLTLAPFLPE